MKAPGAAGWPRTLGVHSGALGDVILFARLLAAAGGPVTLVAPGETARLLAGLGAVAAAVDFHALPMHECFTEDPPAACRLPGLLGRCDRLVSCFAAGRPDAERRLTALTGARDATFLPVRPPAGFDGHLLDLWHDRLGRPRARLDRPAWSVPEAWWRDAAAALRGVGVDPARPYVVLHPGAGGREKCWPAERYAELGRRLAGAPADTDRYRRSDAPGTATETPGRMSASAPAEGAGPAAARSTRPLEFGCLSPCAAAGLPAQPVFVLGPVEAERMGAKERCPLEGGFPILTALPLSALAGVLAGARAFVGNDSGPAHLAAAVGAPTLAIFGPTRPGHFAPVGPHVRTLTADGPMAALPAARVAEALAASM